MLLEVQGEVVSTVSADWAARSSAGVGHCVF